jgi:hypothetical protein
LNPKTNFEALEFDFDTLESSFEELEFSFEAGHDGSRSVLRQGMAKPMTGVASGGKWWFKCL